MGKSKKQDVLAGLPATDVVQRVQGSMMLADLLPGDQWARARQEIVERGFFREKGKELHVRTERAGDDYRVMAIAAVSRDPGLSQTYLDQIQDYLPTSSGGNRARTIDQLWRIYENEGVVHNAINKIAAILSAGGRYKVRFTKKGKRPKAIEELQAALDLFRRKVNNSPLDGVVTGDRGLQMVTHQAVRSALVEGDWIGRTVWVNQQVGSTGTFSLPMIIQTIPMAQIEADANLEALGGLERFFWVPPRNFVDQLKKPSDADVRKLFQKYIPRDIQSKLIKDGRVLLDPALLLHIRHRGVAWRTYGESFVTPAKPALAFKKAVENLDFVSMSSLISRLNIIMVGSSDPKSPYSKADVALARTALMQSFFDEAGPNMTIIWEGDDVKVESVSAHETVLDLNKRHELAEQKVKVALGVPDALLSGTTNDAKSAGWAAVIGASAELEELQANAAGVWETLGERIAEENGFVDVDLTFEFDRSLLVDKDQERNQNRNDYITGGLSIYDYVLGLGKDPEAMYQRMCEEKGLTPGQATWVEAFMPPQGMQGQGEGKVPGNGRTPNSETGKPAEPAPERKTPKENK